MINSIEEMDNDPTPEGELTLQDIALPANTNANGDIYGGWLMSKMDLAGSLKATELAKGRVTTVAAGSMAFLRPVPLGSIVSCYTSVTEVGRSSIRVLVDVWLTNPVNRRRHKATEGAFVYVAIDDNGRTREITL